MPDTRLAIACQRCKRRTAANTQPPLSKQNAMNLEQTLTSSPLILTECAIAERLRRRPEILLHPTLFNTPLIREEHGRRCLAGIYQEYLDIAQEEGLPILLCAPTWRLDKQRVAEAGFDATLLHDAVDFIRELTAQQKESDPPRFGGALLAPKNDCYLPGQGLSREESRQFHSWQVEVLAQKRPDVIVAQTMPTVSEALGMGDLLGQLDTPYILSFVIDRRGRVLDFTPLLKAIESMDDTLESPPLGYMVNCVHPSFIRASEQPSRLFERLIGIQANSSAKDHSELDGSTELQQDPLCDWSKQMRELNSRFGVKILGGCCGTDGAYLRSLCIQGC